MIKKTEKIIDVDVDVIEDNRTETQDFAELNVYKNELVAKNREITKQEELVKASINEFIGMTKAQALTENFNKTLRTLKLLELKNNNLYKNITFIDFEGNPRQVTNWEDFCKAIGTSKSSVEEDIKNLITFGQNFMQLCETKGITIRELRRMRQNMQNPMVTEQEKIAIEEAKGKNPQEMLTLLEELQDKQAALEEKVKGLEDDIAAKDKVSSDKSKKIQKLELDLAKMSGKSPENLKQAEKNRIFNSLDREFSTAVSNFQSLKAAFFEMLRMQEEGSLDEDENARFEEGVLLFLTNAMRLLSEMRTKEYDFIQAVDKLGLLWLFVEYDKQTMPTFTLPEA